jgi:hypothetical protein
VAGSQEDATGGLALADDVAGRWRRQDAILADEELLDAICRTDLGDQLDNLWVPEPSIAANDEEGILEKSGELLRAPRSPCRWLARLLMID